ncbi:MAG: hypothetical protein M1431_06080 [Candidatus Thermoplasmatota archaeon]|nr:hypothetical protein [Candidatus Thermoplasmatota archaeon]
MTSLAQEKPLKDDIISDLTTDEKSISGLQKSLEDRGRNLHRLVLTGYLKAMVDLGVLKEREIKPSRIYSVNASGAKDIYDIVGIAVHRIGGTSLGDDALAALNFLFNRPIFAREIERCNVEPARDYRKVLPTRKLEVIQKLSEQGIKIPQSNVMMEPEGLNMTKLLRILREIIYISMDLRRYSLSDQENVQKTLD